MNSIVTYVKFEVEIVCVWCGYRYLVSAKEQMQKTYIFSIDTHECDPADLPVGITEV